MVVGGGCRGTEIEVCMKGDLKSWFHVNLQNKTATRLEYYGMSPLFFPSASTCIMKCQRSRRPTQLGAGMGCHLCSGDFFKSCVIT